MEQAQAEVAEEPGLQFRVRLDAGLDVQHRGVLDQRADDVRLPACCQPLAQLAEYRHSR